MSNISGNSSGPLSALSRGSIVGVPHRSWSGEAIVLELSKSKNNPYRKYFRCAHAAAAMQSGDKHVFKLMNEAILRKIDILDAKISSLTQELMATRLETERVQREVENTIFERLIWFWWRLRLGSRR